MEKRNWEQTGLLEGLTNTREIVEKHFNEVEINSLPYYKNDDELLVETMIFPVIRRIVHNIINSDSEHGDCTIIYDYEIKEDNWRGLTRERVLAEIKVDEITKLLVDYAHTFIPYSEKYLPDLDWQAELTVLFCKNYVFKLIERVQKKYKTK